MREIEHLIEEVPFDPIPEGLINDEKVIRSTFDGTYLDSGIRMVLDGRSGELVRANLVDLRTGEVFTTYEHLERGRWSSHKETLDPTTRVYRKMEAVYDSAKAKFDRWRVDNPSHMPIREWTAAKFVKNQSRFISPVIEKSPEDNKPETSKRKTHKKFPVVVVKPGSKPIVGDVPVEVKKVVSYTPRPIRYSGPAILPPSKPGETYTPTEAENEQVYRLFEESMNVLFKDFGVTGRDAGEIFRKRPLRDKKEGNNPNESS